MTDFWPDDDTENIWHMTDEAWASYVRWRDGYGDDSVPSVGYSGSGRGVPVGEPRIDRNPSLRPLSAVEAELDFKPICQQHNCTQQAEHFISWHPVDKNCVHPVYASEGRLMHRLVCEWHLKVFERKAEDLVLKLQPSFWVRFFRDEYARCPGCGMAILHPGDILTFVRGL